MNFGISPGFFETLELIRLGVFWGCIGGCFAAGFIAGRLVSTHLH